MKSYWQLLLLIGFALAGALGWRVLSEDPGYVLVTFRGWSVESTFVVAMFLGVLLLLVLGLLWRLVRAPLAFWRRRRLAVARERLATAVVALQEGRWDKAEKLLQRAASDPSQRSAAHLLAAGAALRRGNPQRHAGHLLELQRGGDDATALIANVESLMQQGRQAVACEMLEAASATGSLPPRAVELRVECLLACARAEDALALLPELHRCKVRQGDDLLRLEAAVAVAALNAAGAAGELELTWKALPRRLRTEPVVVSAYAGRAQALGAAERAASVLESQLGKQWSEDLAAQYGTLGHADLRRAIKRAEGWLQAHPQSSALLLSLGRMCRREQLWGKAEDFLQRAVEGRAAEAWEALGELYIDRQDHGRAQQALRNALLAGRGEAVTPVRAVLPAQTVDAIFEERSSMGVPRLPAD